MELLKNGFSVTTLSVQIVKIVAFLQIFFLIHGPSFAQDLLSNFPFITKDFQQIVIVSDFSHRVKSQVESLMGRTNDIHTLGALRSFVVVEIDLKNSSNSNFPSTDGKLDIFSTFDQDLRTVVVFSAENSTKFIQRLDQILDTFNGSSVEGNRRWKKETHWQPFYFFLWPTANNKSNSESAASLNSELMRYLHHFSHHVPLNADVFWIQETSENKNKIQSQTEAPMYRYSIWESYFVKEKNFVQEIHLNVDGPHFIWQLKKFKWHRRGDFNGALIIATAVADPIYAEEVKFTMNENGTVELDHGMSVNIFRTFRSHLNFTEGAIIGEYMLESTDNSSAGMELQLEDGRADISITESAMSHDKAEVVQLLHATTGNWLEARLSQLPSSRWKFLLSTFSPSVWVATTIYFIGILLCVRFLRRLTGKDDSSEDKHQMEMQMSGSSVKSKNGCEFWSFFSSLQLDFVWALATLCQQGWYDWPRQTPVKILFLVASTTGFLLYTAYSGTMTSKLSVATPITVTFEDLMNTSYTFYLENDFDFPVDISQRPDIRIDTLYTLEDAASAVRNISTGKSALVSYPEFFYAATRFGNYTNAQTCSSFTSIRISIRPSLCAMAVRKLSPFKEIFNVKTMFIMERGILRRIDSDYQAATQLRCNSNSHTSTPQPLSDLFVAYASIVFGTVISACFLIIEIFMKLPYTCSII